MKNLLIVESPGKVAKIKSFLGSDWTVLASCGHIRELAKDTPDSLGFILAGDRVETHYIFRDGRSQETVSRIRAAAKHAGTIILATDEDREGESISWHLADVLGLKSPQRATFTEITKPAVLKAVSNPRSLDRNLVAAARCRDCLDKLVGYQISPLVWQLDNGSTSAGRVQSATLHLICVREQQIQSFVPQDYWSVYVIYAEGFKAFYVGDERSAAEEPVGESDDAGEEDKNKSAQGTRVTSQEQAEKLVKVAQNNSHRILKIEGKTDLKKPPAPFTTSALQQAAGVRLGLSPEVTMKVAQTLYEGGHITYMRTDSVALSPEFKSAVRDYLGKSDPDNVPEQASAFKNKDSAQEAHEAIRPTHVETLPDSAGALAGKEVALYDLIWRRAVASQCKPAALQKTIIVTESDGLKWTARGQVVTTAGYTKYWNDISADSQLPSLQGGQTLTLKSASADKKETVPPSRYSEPKLVQLMEREGIGRPSTYAATLAVLKNREYVSLKGKQLQPTKRGIEVDRFLAEALPDLIRADFTAKVEGTLDAIAQGSESWEKWLNEWNQSYLVPALEKAQIVVRRINPNYKPKKAVQAVVTEIVCPTCGKQMSKVAHQVKNADHFLKCDNRNGGCGAAMFLNESGEYVLAAPQINKSSGGNENDRKTSSAPTSGKSKPKGGKGGGKPASQSAPSAIATTEHNCPVCQSSLERYNYSRDGKNKAMLRCSKQENRRDSCKDVAFFQQNQNGWWSPKFGELTGS